MAHAAQIEFCTSIKNRFPDKFKNVDVLDCGSLDINGNNRYLFEDYTYRGLDVGEGKNVDIVCPVHKFNPAKQFDVVISTEMLEHDTYSQLSLYRMFDLVKKGGILLITCAGEGRQEHGTTRTAPQDAPFTNDWYKNIHCDSFSVLHPDVNFSYYEISKLGTDIRFFGIKK